jgi:peptidoglycan/LPS O-acetylase OafA/YrhL
MTQTQAENSRRKHFRNLDTIRSIACLGVFLAHGYDYLNFRTNCTGIENVFYLTFIRGAGPAGVSLFFVLSGFLISSLLFEEKIETGSIDLKTFYLKRILRIWPMFFLHYSFPYGLTRSYWNP